VATEIERAFAEAGHIVVSNSKNHRMERDVPLLVPEINPDHLKLVPLQQRARGWKGQIVTNPNCSTVVLTMGLAPLKAFGISKVIATTMQAISGAGYPGVPSMDIVGNVIPFIGGEEEKMEQETQKILGEFRGDHIEPLPARVSAHCNRVPVVDGHTVTVSVELSAKPSQADLRHAFDAYTSVPQQRQLPSAPPHPVIYMDQANRRSRARTRSASAAWRLHRPPAPLPGAGLQVRRPQPQHRSRRRRRGRPERRADAIRRDAGPMIVMKFGARRWNRPPPSSASPALSRRAGSAGRGGGFGHGQDHQQAAGHCRRRHCGHREEYIRQIQDLRDYHSREARQVTPLDQRAELDRTLDEHFQELTELVKGLAVLAS